MKTVRSPLSFTAGIAALALCATSPLSGHADGTLRYATVGEPPSLDQHVVTSDLATTIAHHIFEGLYTFDAKLRAPTPAGLGRGGQRRRQHNHHPPAGGRCIP